MSVQNPTIPTATQAKGIDSIILDLQTHLDTELVWLTNGMGRAYRLSKVRTNQTTVFLPEVYLGVANRYDYFAATPDNDKQGQNIFFVGDAILPDQQKGFYGWLEYEVGIIFNANLELIDSALLVSEDFTEHLIQDVREALIRDLVGKSYRLNIDSITREFDDVYAEFDVSRDRGIAHAPLTHFRVNCTIQFREDCAGVSLDRCGAILQNLSTDDKLNCILPTYDFSSTAVQNATTAQQQSDMTDWLCVTPAPTPYSMDFDGVNEYIRVKSDASLNFEYNTAFSLSCYVKLGSSKFHNLINKFDSSQTEYGVFALVRNTNNLSFILYNDTTFPYKAIYINSNSTLSLNTWYRLDFVYKGTPTAANAEIWINGVKDTTTTIADNLGNNTINNPNTYYRLGNSAGDINGLDGLLHEVKIYNIALSGSDISTDNTNVLAFNNGTISSYTPVQSANLAFRNATGSGAIFGALDWVFPDEGTGIGSQSVSMEEADRNSDIPLSL
jgi:hypothetical protein